MSRNSIFIILGLIAAGLAYFLNPSLTGLVGLIMTERLPYDFIRLVQNSGLVAFAGYISLFGLLFFLLYVIFPLSYVWYHINSANNIIAELPLASDATARTSKEIFLSRLKDLGFVGRLARIYGAYLVQGPDEEISTESLKNARIIKKGVGRGKNRKIIISPASATAPAEIIFNADSLVNDNLLLGFFAIFARILVGVGVISLGISLLSLSLTAGGQVTVMSPLQPGMTAFLYCLTSAVIISGLTRLFELILSQNSRALARMINALFHQGGWQQDIKTIQENLVNNSALAQVESVLQGRIDKPLKEISREISRAVKQLSEAQEQKLDNILSKTLDSYSGNLEKKSAANIENLNKILKETAHTADLMKKQFTGASSDFSKQMDKQSAAIARHLADMQKISANSEKATQKGSEKIISSLASEVKSTHKQLDEFIKSNLKKLDEKQTRIEKTFNDKNSILKDLHNSARDLGTISNASGMLLERFIALSGELDGVLKKIQQNGFSAGRGDSEKRDKLRQAMIELKKANRDRIDKLPEM